MPSWLVLFAIIVVCLTVLLFIKRDTTEGFGMFKDEQMAFANKQYTYFHDTAGKGIFTNPGLNLTGLNDALAQPDLYLAKSKDRDYTSYFAEDPEIAYNQKDEAFCKKALSPRDLPKRTQGADVGCGWYYVDNAAVPSSGALGTISGPIFSKALPANGEWIWDISKAIMKEEIKACRRVKSCDLMSVDGIRGKCGFCERLGYAVPINYDGTEKYPDSDVGSCGQLTIKDAAGCFKPTPKPLVTSDGIDCGTYGYPSPDNSMRMYLKSECDTLNGTLSPNGECVNKAGVSYSWSCRGLNRPNVAGVVMEEEEEEEEDGSGMKKVATVVKNICATNSNGGLSRECLQSLATGLGYAKTGAMMRLLSGNAAPGETDRLAIDELKKSGYAVPNAILGSGDIDMLSAANLYQKIYEAMARGQTALSRQAAKWLVTGTDTFDICEIDANATGPFPTACLQRAFRMSGCQASGNKYPDDRTALDYANKSWTAVNSMFSNLYATMKSSKASEQDAAVKDCLGFAYARPPPPPPVVCDLLMGDMTYNSNITGISPKLVGKHLYMFMLTQNLRHGGYANRSEGSGHTSAFFTDKRPVTNFYTSFTVHDRNTHKRGMTFFIQNQSPNAIGGGQVGSDGINPGFAIPLTGVQGNVEIKYSNNTLKIIKNGIGGSTQIVDLPKLLGGTSAWFGFTAGALMAAGGCANVPGHHSYSINDWKMTHDPNAPVVASPVPQPLAVVPTVALDPSDLLASPMTFNGWRKPKIVGKELHLLTNGAGGVSAFLTNKRSATKFHTSFTARFASGHRADGMTFCIQNQLPNALGQGGGGLGFLDIRPGVAIRLDNFYSDEGGLGRLSVGYLPTGAAISDTGSGYKNLAESGDITQLLGLVSGGDWLLNVEIKYSNNNLSIIITNAKNTALTYGRSIGNVDLPRLLGGNNAWMGFTAGTGQYGSEIFISKWKISEDPRPEKYVRVTLDKTTPAFIAPGTQIRWGSGNKWLSATADSRAFIASAPQKMYWPPSSNPNEVSEIQAFL